MAKLTKSQKQYQKEIQKIKRRISRLQKRGYTIDVEIPKGKSLKSLQKEYSLEALYKRAEYITADGRVISGTEARKLERSKASKKGWEKRREKEELAGLEAEELPLSFENVILANLDALIDTIESWAPKEEWTMRVALDKQAQKDKLLRVLNNLIGIYGKTVIAERLNRSAESIYEIANRIMYESYLPTLVYYERANWYDPSEDYIRLEEILGGGVFTLEDVERLDENY